MIRFSRGILRVAAAAFAVALVAPATFPDGGAAQSVPSDAFYEFVDPTSYDPGCYGPCDCPVYSYPMSGMFRLVFQSVDPLYTNYAVEDFDAVVRRFDDSLRLRGRGTYRIGGEFALVHQMILDLDADGTPEHHDSGLVPGGIEFPTVVIALPAHAYACSDTVLDIHAARLTGGVEDPPGPADVLHAAPNPFTRTIELSFVQAVAGPAEASVFDAQGRLARRLPTGGWSAAGPRALDWDGRLDRGAAAPAGLYFVRVRTPGREWMRRVVRID
jgi:hypothetical protein